TKSSSREFDLYARQTYIDNIMRGGYPQVFKFGKSETVYYLYSRKHGDLERDYNKFEIQPAYFSQGNGNYRDVNQNRRMDTWFNPEVKDENLVYFFSLLQADGFNPLVVRGARFIIKDQQYLKSVLTDIFIGDDVGRVAAYLAKPFTPGDLALFIEESKIKLLISEDEAIRVLLSHSFKTQEAQHGEGFWTDHWTYNLDLIDNYLGVYPEKLRELIFEKKVFTFFDNSQIVQPRSAKYTLYNGKPRQLKSVVECVEKQELIKSRKDRPNVVRVQYGKGEIYQTTLINKLVCLMSNKLASLDPFGVGIEMEANKPNWYDALNGLPALFGSSLSETL
ncbi:MAG: cellobiose phosphorylase, partial [Candidatus Omnitrophica bacterium]|nr:cellobiose phosphorylase [Candidatus Omnitrophota bacterium]